MAPKRKAQEAFGKPKGQLSAFAAARIARQSQHLPTPVQDVERSPETVVSATSVAEVPYDGRANGSTETSSELPRSKVLQLPPGVGPNTVLSTVHANRAEVDDGSNNNPELTLHSDQTVCFVGEYHLEVLKGAVSVYGALLHAGSGLQRVHAASTHALPQITARTNNTIIRVSSASSIVSKLDKLSPLFRNIWADSEQRTFSLLHTSADDALQRNLMPLEIDKSFHSVLTRLASQSESNARTTRIMAIGAKSSGKSTFNRLLCNTMISRSQGRKCLYLDLDPGQPEFGPPGQVSLVEVTAPILGPPFTHPASFRSRQYRMLRSHTLAATTFKDDPAHYLACAADLAQHVDRQYPLIVNSCGWVSGLGASVLSDLVSTLSISNIVILDPIETGFMEWLQEACADVEFHRLSRQPPRPSPRTPAETRNMQTMAYMHHRYRSSGTEITWSGTPIGSFRPWSATYSGKHAGIHAIMSYGQSPSSEFLSEVLEGSIVAIVSIEETSLTEAFALQHPLQQALDVSNGADTGDSALASHDLIERTAEGLPYVRPNEHGFCPPLSPTYSACAGLALVRSIDMESESIQLVTPLSESEIADLMTKKVVLVRGSFDSPGWAYLEDIYSKENGDGARSDTTDRPWVSKKDMVGIEGAVWRLRHPPMAAAVASR